MQVFKSLLPRLVRLNTSLLSFIHRGNPPNLGGSKEVVLLSLPKLQEVYLQKYRTPFSRTSFVVFSLFLIYAMAGEIVYADIKTVRASPLEHSSPLQRSDSHHHGIFLKVGCAMIIILLVIAIVLSIFVIQLKSARHTKVDNESKEKYCTGKNKSGTITSIVSSNSPTAHKSCLSKDWKLHGGKCYWVAENKKSWGGSKNDCAMKNSHLMVIQDFTDMSFLWLHLNISAIYWIGLSSSPGGKSWTWVDNNSFDVRLFSIKEQQPRTRSMKCAQVSSNMIAEQNCEANNQWICQL
ncbi:killer cell lectin-like receptor subfamily B member 1B allele B [Equus asinus]|uniref:C-type lectin like 1, pseudo n=1 Tax=Equus asinus TaxID=9793 RepID=A0A8C4M7L1_EQUAS|nr:C-type lectin-like domain family 1 [Equus asinus]